jgi:hypothetical protein
MTRSHNIVRTLAATLAISALAATGAVAKPVHHHAYVHPPAAPVNAPGTDVGAPDQQAPATGGQDLRSPDAADVGSPVRAQTVRSVPAQAADGDGTPWTTIGLCLLGACLAVAGTAATAGRIRRSRVAA